jgi:hypothetical protein
MAATANDCSHAGLVGLICNVITFNFRLLHFFGTLYMKDIHLSMVLLQLCLYTILSRDMRPGDTSRICLFILGELERSKDST